MSFDLFVFFQTPVSWGYQLSSHRRDLHVHVWSPLLRGQSVLGESSKWFRLGNVCYGYWIIGPVVGHCRWDQVTQVHAHVSVWVRTKQSCHQTSPRTWVTCTSPVIEIQVFISAGTELYKWTLTKLNCNCRPTVSFKAYSWNLMHTLSRYCKPWCYFVRIESNHVCFA